MWLVGVTGRAHPLDAAVTSLDLDVLSERSLPFVASTRAREDLFLSWHGTPRPLCPRLRGGT